MTRVDLQSFHLYAHGRTLIVFREFILKLRFFIIDVLRVCIEADGMNLSSPGGMRPATELTN